MTLLAILLGQPFWARPIDASLDGHRSDWMFDYETVAISILFAIMVGVMIWASVAHRARPGWRARYDLGMARKNLALTALACAAMFLGIDGIALYHSYLDLGNGFWHFPSETQHPVEIEVYAQQWAWNIRYPGPDGEFNTADDVVTLNDMRVPIDRPVLIRMKSKDVVHSFYLPNFRIKQDVIPGSITQLWFQAKRLGTYEIGCAQHCGASHYKMRGLLKVLPADEYQRWLVDEAKVARRSYDETDPGAHWGWDWEI